MIIRTLALWFISLEFFFVAAAPTVTIANGTLHGVSDRLNGVDKFFGVPYAQPPVGALRLRQAIPLTEEFGEIDATSFGPSCYGRQNPNPNEDCLTLNIWRSSSIEEQLPVFVWFYGGSLSNGYTADLRFEGTNMVHNANAIGKQIIFVTINYRLGPLGFLNGKQMADLGLLNIGMLDQRLALHWVRDNIEAFGGDPQKVTIGGQSAGAVSTYSHMMAYGGRDENLFRGAIMQSGGAFPLTGPETTEFQETFDSLIENTACSSLATASAVAQLDCIRELPIETFLDSVGSSTGQSIDGGFTSTSVQFAFPAGAYVKVPVLVGANTDEGTTSAPTDVNTTEQLRGPLATGFHRPLPLLNKMVDDILALYPTDPALGCPYNTGETLFNHGSLDKQACSIFGDLVQVAPARMIARSLSSHPDSKPVYRYRFNTLPHNATNLARGITTGLEQSFVFGNVLSEHPWDVALSREMTRAWISFVHDLDPNWGAGSALPYWPAYGSDQTSIVFSAGGSTLEVDDYRAEAINYLIENVLPYGAQ